MAKVAANPTRELLELLEKLMSQNTQTQFGYVLSSAVGLRKGHSEDDLLAAWLGAMSLVRRAIERTERLSVVGSTQDYLAWGVPLEKLFALKNLRRQWKSVKRDLSPLLLQGLKFAALAIDQEPEGRGLEEDQLARLQQEVADLVEAMVESEVPNPLKDRLIGRLEEVRRVLLLFRLYGPEKLDEAMAGLAGTMLLDATTVVEASSGDSRVRKVFGRVWRLIQAVQTAEWLTAVGEKLPRLLG